MDENPTPTQPVPSPAPANFVPPQGVAATLINTTPELLAHDVVGGLLSRLGPMAPAADTIAAPQPTAPQPVAPQPVAPQPVAPQPVAPQPVAPQPVAPQPVAPQPVAPQPVAPQPADLNSRYAAPDSMAKPEFPTLPEVPAEQPIPEPQNVGDSARHAFAASRAQTKQFREMAERYRQEAEASRQKYEEYSKRENALAEQLTAEQKRSHDLEEEIGKLDLARSSSFRQQYDIPLQTKQDEIRNILTANGMQENDAAELANSIMMADADQIPGMVSNLPTVTQGMIMVKHNEADQLWAARSHAIEDWRTTQAGLHEVSTRADAVANAQHRSDLANTALDRIRGIDTMIWNAPEFVARRTDAIEKAKAWYQTAPEDQIAAAAMEGVLAQFAYERIHAMEAEIRNLTGQIDAMNRMRSPTIAPFYRSVPAPATPAPAQQPQRPGWPQPSVGPATAMEAAEMAVRSVFDRR